jgi:uncharacterized protein YqgC (DUF456 family)
MHLIGTILFFVVSILGLVIIPVGLPGTFVILAASVIYAAATGFAVISLKLVAILAGIALFAELLEFIITLTVVRLFGASAWGLIGTLAGGIIGAIAGSGAIPVIGTLLGAVAGAFLGAMAFELIKGRELNEATRAGTGSFVGKLTAISVKLICGIIMVVLAGTKVAG